LQNAKDVTDFSRETLDRTQGVAHHQPGKISRL